MFELKRDNDSIIIKLFPFRIRFSFNLARFFVKKFCFLIRILDCILSKNKNKIVVHLAPKQENKIYKFTDYIEKNHPEYKISYIIQNNEYIKANTFHIYSFRAIWEMLTSKYVVISSIKFFLDYYKSKKHAYVNLWHGMPIKTLGYTNLAELKDKKTMKYFKFIGDNFKCFATSDLFKHLLSSCFMVEDKNVFVTGCPVTDIIIDNDNKNVEELFKFNNYKNTVLYLPTYKTKHPKAGNQIKTEYNNIFYFENFTNSDFVEFLEKNNILFVMKPHPHDEKFYLENLDTLPQSDNFKVIFDKDLKDNKIDLYEMFKYTDLMIGDYSSVTIDFLILNRPVLYLDNLSEDYSSTRGMILPDNYEILMPGHMIKTYKELEEKIIDSLTVDSTKDLRTRTIPLLHKHCDAKASERIFEIMKGL